MRVDFVQRNDRDTLFELPVLQQVLANLLVLDDNVVKLSTRSNLEGCGLRELGMIKLDERGDETLNFRTVEVRMRGLIAEIEG